jgi:hypothetical protein
LQLAVETKDRQRNKQHEVWDDSFDWKDCRSDDFIKQKLDYMHRNPCKGKWNLASSPLRINIGRLAFMPQASKAIIL